LQRARWLATLEKWAFRAPRNSTWGLLPPPPSCGSYDRATHAHMRRPAALNPLLRVQPSSGPPPTDFSAFNALVRNERMQQQTGQPSGSTPAGTQPSTHPGFAGGGSAPAASRPPQPPRPQAQVQVTTFDQLTTNRLPAEELDHTAQLEGVSPLAGA
jgi:hypothetical protein